jgi:hypothetical protein
MTLENNAPQLEPTPEPSFWDLSYRLSSVLSEGLVAEWMYRQDPSTYWLGGNTPLQDVVAPKRGWVVDVKAGFRNTYVDVSGATRRGLGFMGAKRLEQVREGVTHYAIALIQTDAKLHAPAGEKITISGGVTGEIYFVPRDELNQNAVPGRKKSGDAGLGLNRWMPEEYVEQFRVTL